MKQVKLNVWKNYTACQAVLRKTILGRSFNLDPTALCAGGADDGADTCQAWLPDGYSRIFRIVCVWPFGLLDYGSATLRCKI